MVIKRILYSACGICRLIFLLITCSLFCSSPISAQEPVFKHYSVAEGLASTTVYSSIQDHQGYLWFATESGVSRFNGRTFDHFSVDDGIADSEIFRLFEDRNGRIWFLSFNGKLSFYKDGVFYNETNTEFLERSFCGFSLLEIREDSVGRLWITTNGNVLLKIEHNKITKYRFPLNTTRGSRPLVIQTASGIPHFIFNDRVYKYDEKANQFFSIGTSAVSFLYQCPTHSETTDRFEITRQGILMNYGPEQKIIIPNAEGSSVLYYSTCYFESDSMLWVGTHESGVKLYSLHGDSVKLMSSYLEDRQISDIEKDTEGNLWFCTKDEGVYMMPMPGNSVRIYGAGNTFPTGNIYAVFIDKWQRIWAGSDRGFLTCIDKSKNKISQFRLAAKGKNNYRVTDIDQDHQGNIWVSTSYNTHVIDTNGRVTEAFFYNKPNDGPRAGKSISIGSDGTVYVAFYAGVVRYNASLPGFEYLPNLNHPVRTFHIHSRKMGMMISNINGLCRYTNDSLVPLYTNDERLSNRIAGIESLNDSTLVIATHGRGILVYQNDTIIQVMDKESGLPTNDCQATFVSGNELWVVTGKGILRCIYVNQRLVLVPFNLPSTLLSIADIRSVATSGSYLYIGTSTGLYEVDLKFHQEPAQLLNVLITGFEINNSPVQTGPEQELRYFQNNIGFNFESISFSNPDKITYKYRITEAKDAWRTTRSNRVQFTLLPPGQYTFEVRAGIVGSDWGPVSRQAFVIKPQFWKQTWFYVLEILLGIGAVSLPFYIYYRRKIAQRWSQLDKQMAVNKERQRISHDLHDDLGSSLTSILMNTEIIRSKMNRSLSYNKELNDIHRFANDANEKMSDIIWAISAYNDNLSSLCSYILEFISEFEEQTGISCVRKVEEVNKEISLRPEARKNLFLFVKEAFHNIQKHSGANQAEFRFFLTDRILNISIMDDGKGIDFSNIRDSSVGLAGMKKRIVDIQGKLELFSSPGKGTELVVRYQLDAVRSVSPE